MAGTSSLKGNFNSTSDIQIPLFNLSQLHQKMDSLQQFIAESIDRNSLLGKDEMDMISNEITSAIHQIIVNGSALISSTQSQTLDGKSPIVPDNFIDQQIFNLSSEKLFEVKKDFTIDEHIDDDENCEIVELDEVELLGEHVHFCEICGKGFKRDANLRMHMRAHGNQFKTLEALTKQPDKIIIESSDLRKKVRFSCPFVGCSRNKLHKKFRPLKSAVCVKNHFRRSH
ncbi:protein SENSITIVE TO PROTON RHIZOTOXICITY 1-like [Papaver somniferum]|uniref:protein SENSITIVE TO PROTON RHIZOTOXICITY 1-like n=1 Tax=Papaver somniferum TaxID=3469 RepID=UPI000E704758|nr:protein SENSITIVE TO PROTON RHIZOTOXICITY 1-like [Papaver somniferum]